MIISRIDGGLGNQLFQYAYGCYLAQKHQTRLLLDSSSYVAQPQHGYLLDRFAITADCITDTEQHRIPRRYRSGRNTSLQGALLRLFPLTTLRRHKESGFGFSPRHLEVADDRYLVGYWQSEQFFPGMRAELLQQFTPREPLSDASRRILDRMATTNSLAVHVRRGDYLTNNEAAKIYCHLSPNYYTRAIGAWAATQAQPHVYVFSNDIPWCRDQLELPYPVTFVDHNSAATAHEDLMLMSHAKCCVIANSTFSWWAAWLNTREDRAVYAPSEWFQAGTLDGSSLIPSRWNIVPSTRTQSEAA